MGRHGYSRPNQVRHIAATDGLRARIIRNLCNHQTLIRSVLDETLITDI
jgi:hypothetical protein